MASTRLRPMRGVGVCRERRLPLRRRLRVGVLGRLGLDYPLGEGAEVRRLSRGVPFGDGVASLVGDALVVERLFPRTLECDQRVGSEAEPTPLSAHDDRLHPALGAFRPDVEGESRSVAVVVALRAACSAVVPEVPDGGCGESL